MMAQRTRHPSPHGRRRRHFRLTRDLVLFSVGVAGLIYEITIGGARPEVMTVCLTLVLAPGVLRYDERRPR